MKKLSKFQILLLTVFGSLGVAGVLVFALAISRNSNAAIGEVVIWGTFDDNRISAVLGAATDSDGRLLGVSYVEKDPTTYEAELADAIASGAGPDLFFVRQDMAARNAGKVLRIAPDSLSAAQFESTFLASASPFLGSEGAVGVPLINDPLMLFWNRPLLGASGFTQPPRYWDEVAGMAQVLTVQADAGTITKSGIALGSYTNIADAKDILSALILQAGGNITEIDENGKITAALSARGAATDPVLAALNFYTQFANPSHDSYSWNRSLPEAQTAFAQGDVGLYIGYASEAALIRQKNPNLDFALAPLPQTRSAAIPLTLGRTYALAISRSSKNPQGALTVAYILASPSVSQGFASVLGVASALRAVVAPAAPAVSAGDTPLDRLVAQAPKSTQDLVNSQAAIARAWADPDPVATGDMFRAMIEDTVSGAAKPTDALSRAEKQLKQIIGI